MRLAGTTLNKKGIQMKVQKLYVKTSRFAQSIKPAVANSLEFYDKS